jgi:amino acid transporter
MLFGDLGTSRLYVLGLAFYFTRHASLFHILFVNILLVLVAGCYLIICRKYPEGGGVYSSARHTSRTLAVIGALMLCADYTVTAAMSCLDAFRYLGISGTFCGIRAELFCTLGAIGIIGVVNWFGPRGMGRMALGIALATAALTLVVAVFSIPSLHHTRVEFPVRERYSLAAWGDAWVGFTEIVLALSGIEAIANMTGIMVPPVRATARRAILPVLVEVVVLNLILAAAMNALPDAKLIDPEGHPLGTDDMMNVLAENYVGRAFAGFASIVFGCLLLSAVNTAMTDLVAIQYMMAKDREVPGPLGKLNRHGVPGLALLVAMIFPGLLLVFFPDLTQLAGLYSVGVVGAISINLLSTGFTRQFELKAGERWMLVGVGCLMTVILATLLWNKPEARSFSFAVLNLGLAVRLLTLAGKAQAGAPGKGFAIGLAVVGIVGQLAMLVFLPAEGAAGFLLSVTLAAALAAEGRSMGQTVAPQESRTPLADLDGDYQPKETYLVAASRPSEILEQAARDALNGRAGLEVLFVQVLGLPQMGSSCRHIPEEDPAAVEVFTRAQATATRLGVPLKLVYLTGTSAADRILAAARDCRCSRLYLQLSRRTALQRFFKGDVIGPVAEGIAPEVELVIRA